MFFYVKQVIEPVFGGKYALALEVLRGNEIIKDLESVILLKFVEKIVNGLMVESPIACGKEHTVIMSKPNYIHVTGNNNHGQLGIGSGYTSLASFKTIYMPGVCAIACGEYHTFVLTRDNPGDPESKTKLWVCGSNANRQLGIDNDEQSIYIFTMVPDMDDVVKIACGSACSAVIRRDGTLWYAQKYRGGKFFVENDAIRELRNDLIDIVMGDGDNGVILTDRGELWSTRNGLLFPERLTQKRGIPFPDKSKKIVKGVIFQGRLAFITADGVLYRELYGMYTTALIVREVKMANSGETCQSISANNEHGDDRFLCLRTDGSLWTTTEHAYDSGQIEPFFGTNVAHAICGYGYFVVMTKSGELYVKGKGANGSGAMGLGRDSDGKVITYADDWQRVQFMIPLKGNKKRRCDDCGGNAVFKAVIPFKNNSLGYRYCCYDHQ